MAFDPNLRESFPILSQLFPENPPKPQEFSPSLTPSPMVSLPTSSCDYPPTSSQTSHNFQFRHFSQHPQLNLNRSNLNLVFLKELPSSSSIAFSPPTPSASSYTNNNVSLGDFANTYHLSPHNKMDAFWDLSHKLSFPSGAPAQMGPSPSLLYRQAYGPPLKPRVQDERLSCFLKNNGWEEDDTGDDQRNNDEKKKKVQTRTSAQKNTNIIKGQWTPKEDRLLVQLVERFGVKRWSQVAKILSGRVGKQCRERWHNHLRPDIRKGAWTEEEDKILIEAHKELGNKWAEIARRLVGRSENTVKNHWNATKRRKNAKKQRNKASTSTTSSTLLQDYIRQVTHQAQAQTQAHNYNRNDGPEDDEDDDDSTSSEDWEIQDEEAEEEEEEEEEEEKEEKEEEEMKVIYADADAQAEMNKEMNLMEMISGNWK